MDNLIILLCCAAFAVLFFGLGYFADNFATRLMQGYSMPTSNGKGQKISLFRINGCGMSFAGHFRDKNVEGINTYLTYHMFHFFFMPLIPVSACRVVQNSDNGYYVLGTEKWNFVELLSIYLKAIGMIPLMLAFVFAIVMLCAFIFKFLALIF